ncbi:MAG: S-layer protein [Candidatus Micrarchaeia archaeon]
MKSINVKKIAAVAAGAAMMGAAFAGAVAVDDAGLAGYKFFSGSEPNVKIVVGSKAGPADGVSAANIAAMIGNLAYEAKDVYVVGADGLSCGGAMTGGECVADVSTPGVNTATAYLMKTYVEDRLDVTADTNRSLTGPFYGPATKNNAKLATQDHTNVLSMPNDGAITNSKNLDVKQEQKVYMGAYTYYDTTDKVVKSKETRVLYETTFSNPLPACWATTKTYALCTTNSEKLDRTHTKINFLGDQWVVMSFTLSTGKFTSVKLGKETAYKPFMSIGDEVTAPNGVKAKLTDITSFAFGTLNQPKVTFDVFDENDQNIGTAILQPGETYNDNGIYVYLYDATTGVAGTSYAEVSMFSDVIDLTHGSSISGHGNWKAYLNGEANTAYTYGTSEALQSITLYDDISTNTLAAGESINLITNAAGYKFNFLGLEAVEYDTLNFVVEKPGQVTLGPSQYLTTNFIKVTSARSNAFQFESTAVSDSYIYVVAGLTAPTAHSSTNATYGSFLEWTQGQVFTNTWNGVPFTGSKYDPAIAIVCNATTAAPVTYTITYTNGAGTTGQTASVVMPASATTIYATLLNGVRNITGVVNASTAGNRSCTLTSGYIPGGTVFYYKNADSTNPYHVGNSIVGANKSQGDVADYWYKTTEKATLYFKDYNDTSDAFWLAIPELTEDNAGLTATVGANRFWALLFDKNAARLQFVNALAATTIDKIGYQTTAPGGVVDTTSMSNEAKFTSYRGSTLAGISATSASLNYATSIAHGQYTLTSGAAEGDGMTSSVTAGVGDFLLDQDGYTVEVTDVTGSGGSGDVAGIESLAPSQDTAYDLTPLDTSSTPLVVLDTNPLASSSAQVISIGGQLVNTVSAQALTGVTIDSTTQPMVKVIGSKVVVAGWTAADTTAAANSLISWLAENRDAIQR